MKNYRRVKPQIDPRRLRRKFHANRLMSTSAQCLVTCREVLTHDPLRQGSCLGFVNVRFGSGAATYEWLLSAKSGHSPSCAELRDRSARRNVLSWLGMTMGYMKESDGSVASGESLFSDWLEYLCFANLNCVCGEVRIPMKALAASGDFVFTVRPAK